MNFIPSKRTKPVKRAKAIRQAPAFRRWVKSLQCSVQGCTHEDMDPAHVRYGLPADALKGGTSLKPHDCWIIPLCRNHHDEQHRHGEQTFAVKHKLDPVALSQTLWQRWLRTEQAGRAWAEKHGLGAHMGSSKQDIINE